MSPVVCEHLRAVKRGRSLIVVDRDRPVALLTPIRRLELVSEWLEAVDFVLLRAPVLSRAAEPLPMALGTLNAIHLSTALVWRERTGEALIMATHDLALGLAARSFGFAVIGL